MPGLRDSQLKELLSKPLPAKIAVIAGDSWPYVAPVWFAHEDNQIYVIGRKHSNWVKHIIRNPRVSILIDEYSPP